MAALVCCVVLHAIWGLFMVLNACWAFYEPMIFASSTPVENYSYPLDDHSSSITMPSALPLSICPISSVPPPTQSVPHLQTPLPDASRPQVQIRVGRECPERAKPPSGSRSGVRDSAVCPHIKDGQLGAGHGSAAAKQSKISRRRATNGWMPVGVATEKEVFIMVRIWVGLAWDIGSFFKKTKHLGTQSKT